MDDRWTTRRKCSPPSAPTPLPEVRTQDRGPGLFMEQITEAMPARAAVRVPQLVGRAGGSSKDKSFLHRSPADRFAGLVEGDGCEKLVEAPTN